MQQRILRVALQTLKTQQMDERGFVVVLLTSAMVAYCHYYDKNTLDTKILLDYTNIELRAVDTSSRVEPRG